MKKILFLLLFFCYGSAHAGLFQGNSTGVFINPIGPSGMVTVGVGTNNFTWGSGQSSLDYAGVAFDVDENEEFVFGSLDFFNATSFQSTQADSVDLSVMLTFTAPSGFLESFIYDLGLINSTNTSDPNASADIVNFDNTVPSNFFSIGGIDFTLEFLGFGQLTGGGFTVEDSFRVLEGASATVDLVGRVTSNPGGTINPEGTIPEPATLLLCVLGLLGLLGTRNNPKIRMLKA